MDFDQGVIDIQNDDLDEQLDFLDPHRHRVACGICSKIIEKVEKSTKKFKNCSHVNFHEKCSTKWLKKKKHCPICKA